MCFKMENPQNNSCAFLFESPLLVCFILVISRGWGGQQFPQVLYILESFISDFLKQKYLRIEYRWSWILYILKLKIFHNLGKFFTTDVTLQFYSLKTLYNMPLLIIAKIYWLPITDQHYAKCFLGFNSVLTVLLWVGTLLGPSFYR